MGSAVSEVLPETVSPEYSLYPYQRQVLRDILNALGSPEKRVVAHLPTGAGKTRIAVHVACRLLNECDTDGSLVIWLASTEELCEQAADALTVGWMHLGSREVSIHRYWGNRPLDLRNCSSGFLVTGLAKLRSAASNDHTVLASLATHASVVIFDEAHQAVANTYSFITEQLCSAQPPLVGLTATPGRTATLDESDYNLAQMFRNCKVSIDPKGHDNPVTYLIQNQFLADPRFVSISFESDIPVSDPLPDADYSSDDLDAIGRDSRRTTTIVDIVRGALRRHERMIVFCPSVTSAHECNNILRDEGISSQAITAVTPSDERRNAIDIFKSDNRTHMVMFNYGVLTAGFDAPRTSCVVIARPTTSLVLYSQMVGRAMRGPRSGGNLRAEILTVADTNLPGFGSVTDAFTNWEELWSTKSIK